MTKKWRLREFACLVLAAAAISLAQQPANAGPDKTKVDARVVGFRLGAIILNATSVKPLGPFSDPEPRAAPTVPVSAIFKIDNVGYTLEPGEPTESGKMTKTAWAQFKTGALARRVVIHTFGSSIDTVLAAYRGTDFPNFVRVAGNDNTTAPGISTTHSLIQFDASPGTEYRVQIGGRNNAEGDISLNGFSFPPTGGLSAFLENANGSGFNSRDYICPLGAGEPFSFGQCPAMTFILHNSTSRALTVTTTTTLGVGMTLPAPIVLNPGAVKTATVAFGPTFNTTTARTVAGKVIFTGRVGATIVSSVEHRALVYSKGAAVGPNVVRAKLESPEIRTGFLNEGAQYRITLTNTGAFTAIGCHFRSNFSNLISSYFKTVWQRIDPVTSANIGFANAPASILAGGSQTFLVSTASQSPYRTDTDPNFAGPVEIDCANTARVPFDLANRFDITARGTFEPAEIAPTVSPVTKLILVPTGGSQFFRVAAVNTGPAATLTATPRYVRPQGENDPAKLFGVAVCRTATLTGACLAPEAASTSYSAGKGATNFFRVRVTAPTVNPGFDPGKRRVFLNFEQDALDSVGKVVVGAPSVAVRRP